MRAFAAILLISLALAFSPKFVRQQRGAFKFSGYFSFAKITYRHFKDVQVIFEDTISTTLVKSENKSSFSYYDKNFSLKFKT